jgi:hypothetical protein
VTYYELFELPRAASADDIKKAFRREIAKYHPDKVQHLGREFQDIALTKAAELTLAYKTLSDPAARADYDALLDGASGIAEPPAARPAPSEPPPAAPGVRSRQAEPEPDPTPSSSAFSAERAGARDLVQRATLARFTKAVEDEFKCSVAAASAFDVMCLPDKRLPWHKTPPQILGRFLSQVNGAAITETWGLAVRARKDAQQRELCVFVMAPELSPAGELALAIAEQRRKPVAEGSKPLVMVPLNTRNWNAHVPTDAPPVVKALLARLKSA